jgi:tripartite-type tricarboxylate transporter receptor subunit TctC
MEGNVMTGKALSNATEGMTVRERKPAGCVQAMRRVFTTAGVIVVAVLLIGPMVATLCAQSYPDKPIQFIVPFPPGGAPDIFARIAAPKFSKQLGQPVVVVNLTGGNGYVGYEACVKAKPDGHNFVVASPGVLTTSPGLYPNQDYPKIKDFAPISLVMQTPYVLIVRASLPVNNLKELIEYCKSNPGKVTFASAGVGNATHLAGELLKYITNIDILHVPYKGIGPALIGVVSNEADMLVLSTAGAMAQINAGRVKAIAVLRDGNERVPSLPNVPTSTEGGVNNWEVSAQYGIIARAGTPRDIVTRINAEWLRIKEMPDMKEQARKADLNLISSTPEQFSEFIDTELLRWTKVIKAANIVVK